MYILTVIPFHLFLEKSINNQHYNVNSFSLDIFFTYMYFKIIVLIGKRNLQTRAMSSYTSCCAVCLSHPFSPFPVKSCKKFKADEVYCWRKKLFLKKKPQKKLFFCPSTQERLLNYKSSARKSRKDTVCMYHTMSSISRMAFCQFNFNRKNKHLKLWARKELHYQWV